MSTKMWRGGEYMKKVILGLAVALIAFFGIISFANAGYDHNNNYGCNSDHPCVTATPTPTKSCDKDKGKDKDHKDKDWDKGCQSPTPTVSPSPSPTGFPCVEGSPLVGDVAIPTCVPTSTPTPTQPPANNNGGGSSGGGQANNPPVCSNGDTIELPANPFVVRQGDKATVNFFITQGDNANIYYKVLGQNDWQFSVPNLKPNSDHFVSYTITGLNPQLGYVFGIQQTFGCGGGNYVTAVVVDGPQTRVFNFSYWEWSK